MGTFFAVLGAAYLDIPATGPDAGRDFHLAQDWQHQAAPTEDARMAISYPGEISQSASESAAAHY